MKKGLMLFCVALCLTTNLWARDIKTKSGKVFKNVSISSVTPTGIDISFEKKDCYFIKHIPFTDLSEKIQKEFGYDPKKAEAYLSNLQKHKEMIQKKYAEALKKEKEVSEEEHQLRTRIEAGAVNVLIKITQTKNDGIIGWGNYVDRLKHSSGNMGKIFVFGFIGQQGGEEARVIYPTGLTKYGFPCYAATLEQAVILKKNSNQ